MRKRSERRRLRPRLPKERETLKKPQYFNIIHGARAGGKKEQEIKLPSKQPLLKKIPKPIPPVKRSGRRRERTETPMPRQPKVPLIIKAGRSVRSLLSKGDAVWPSKMPTYPTLGFQRLYTRYPSMKTVTKVTDADGKIEVDFPRPFDEIPGVVMTIKSADAISGNVFGITKTSFEAIFREVKHSHGGTVNDGGSHTPTINADGGHAHDVYGELYYTKYMTYGWLAPYFFTTDESNAGDPHHHNVSNEAADDHYMTDLEIDDVDLWTSYEEDPLHYHTAENVVAHDHDVAEDGGALLKSTSVTITYLAEVESEV